MSEDDVKNAKSMIASASVCVCQLEINPEVTHFTLSLAKKAGGMFSRERESRHLDVFSFVYPQFYYRRLRVVSQRTVEFPISLCPRPD